MLKRASLILLVIVVATYFFVIPGLVARTMNGVTERPPYVFDEADIKTHEGLDIVDLHADTLLWERNPARRGTTGHVDLPRLLEAGLTLQVFSAVTKTPRGLNFERNTADSDNVTSLVIAQRWPLRTFGDLTERALYQSERLHRLRDEANGSFVIVKSRADLARLLSLHRHERTVGGLLAIEGMHAIDGDLSNLKRLYDAGYRMMGLTHFFDNAIGGSAHGEMKRGLTGFGRTAIVEMERLGIVVDLAHASPALIDDVLAIATHPVVVSHTGVKGTCDRTRNLDDERLRAIATNGGLIGIAYFPEAVCGSGPDAIAEAIAYTIDLIGIGHVALGSDFDGAVTTPFDVTGLPLLWGALERAGLTRAEISAVAGGNALALLQRVLPPR